jgi:hypothetical protein
MSIMDYIFLGDVDSNMTSALNDDFTIVESGLDGELICMSRSSIEICDDDEFVMIDVDIESRIKCTTSIMKDIYKGDSFEIITRSEIAHNDIIFAIKDMEIKMNELDLKH